jgi:hypothetical protein
MHLYARSTAAQLLPILAFTFINPARLPAHRGHFFRAKRFGFTFKLLASEGIVA